MLEEIQRKAIDTATPTLQRYRFLAKKSIFFIVLNYFLAFFSTQKPILNVKIFI